MIASHQGNMNIIKKLLEYNADIELSDKFGKSAINKANTGKIRRMLKSSIKVKTIESKRFSISSCKPKESKSRSCYPHIISKNLFKDDICNKMESLKTKVKIKNEQQFERILIKKIEVAENSVKNRISSDINAASDNLERELNNYMEEKITTTNEKEDQNNLITSDLLNKTHDQSDCLIDSKIESIIDTPNNSSRSEISNSINEIQNN